MSPQVTKPSAIKYIKERERRSIARIQVLEIRITKQQGHENIQKSQGKGRL